MTLIDLVNSSGSPVPWSGEEKIPWSEPGFSRRMLEEHLSQDHDMASRRAAIIERHVEWMHREMLGGGRGRLLDLGCGPGLYTSRLSKLGHECVGVDYSPASIAYAEEQARRERLPCTYLLQDIRAADYGVGYALVMLLFGEFNTFSPTDARKILGKAEAALDRNGILLLEPHTYDAVRQRGEAAASWYSAERGLFSSSPHLCLEESYWDAGKQASTTRYFVIDAATAAVTSCSSSLQAYADDGYRDILEAGGFRDLQFFPSLTGVADASHAGLMAIAARRGET